jgi:hypothetical protein
MVGNLAYKSVTKGPEECGGEEKVALTASSLRMSADPE